MSDYIKSQKAWIYTFVAVGAAGLLIIVFIVPFTCKRFCCSFCKKDLTRSDYKKYQKVIPAITFIALALISIGLTSLVVWKTAQIQTQTYYEICSFAYIFDYLNIGSTAAPQLGGSWIGIANMTNLLFDFSAEYQSSGGVYQESFQNYNYAWMQQDLDSINA